VASEKINEGRFNKMVKFIYIFIQMKPTKTAAAILFACIFLQVSAQESQDKLFKDIKPLDIALKVSISQVKDNTGDTLYEAHVLYYRDGKEAYDSVKTEMKTRGKFRLENCYFPPLGLKFQKADVKGTLFEGNKSLKLVVPCKSNSSSNNLVVREFLCYKLYEVITPYCFKTRLVNINFTEAQKKKEKNFQLKGIFIENDNKAAKRFNGKIASSNVRAMPNILQDTADLRVSLFQYMISNTDWSSMYQHNIKLLQRGPNDLFVPITFDFDMAGLVDAPYSVVSETSEGEIGDQQTVKDRLYRGWCRPSDVTEFVRKEFIAKEDQMMASIDPYKDQLPAKEFDWIKSYLREFFKTLKDDGQFRKLIASQCRKQE
jgi:hypothetical protein